MAIPDDENFREDFREDVYETRPPSHLPIKTSGLNEWLLVVTLVLLLAVAVAVGYAVHTQRREQHLAAANGQLAAELTETQNRLTALTDKLNALSAPVPPALPADETLSPQAEQGTPSAAQPGRRILHAHARAVASQWQTRMQHQLSTEQQRIASAEQAIAKTRADMASNADSTRSNLNNLGGSIARDHSELVTLERQGQRSYYEFDLFKSKHFQREGPISLELRHTDTKHGNYDVDLLINDSKLAKKHVYLYEPLVFQTGASPQPLQLVVNRIDKNHIHGYVSVPKSYSERASAATTAPPSSQFSLTPASAPGSAQGVATTTQTGTQASPELTLSRQQ